MDTFEKRNRERRKREKRAQKQARSRERAAIKRERGPQTGPLLPPSEVGPEILPARPADEPGEAPRAPAD